MDNFIEQSGANRSAEFYRKNYFETKEKTVKIKRWHPADTTQNPAFGNLPENQLFNAENKDFIQKIAPYLERIAFAGNDSVYQPGDEIDYIYFPQSSVFSEFQILEDGATIEIAMVGSEGIVGLGAFFDINRATSWTQISAAGNALRIKSKILREQASGSRNLQRFLYACAGSYIKHISQRSVCNSCHSLEKRLCSWLLMMQDRLKSTKLPLTQEQMARILGANRPSVTTIAGNLRAADIIDYRRGVLYINDRKQLENRACGCYGALDNNFRAYF